MNRAWHERNRLQRGASLEERVSWHREHAKECGCRPAPPSIQALLGGSRAPRPKSPKR